MKRGTFFSLALSGTAATLWAIRGATAAPQRGHFAVTHSDSQWRKLLGPQRYAILRDGGTEAPYSSPLNAETRPGSYACAGCHLTLFKSEWKYNAHEGWPSFWTVIGSAISMQADHALFEERTEVHCVRCGGHLGHRFHDGPRPTGLRYCIDGLALRFTPRG